MTVETATYISDLNPLFPGSADLKSEGDDHMRLTKSVIKTTFPNITGAVTATQAGLNSASSVASSGTFPGVPITGVTNITASGTVTATTFSGAATDATKLPLSGGTITGALIVNNGTANANILTVQNTGAYAYFAVDSSTGSSFGYVNSAVIWNGVGGLLFGTANVERMRIDTSGNVGIGTVPLVGKLLSLGGNIRFTLASSSVEFGGTSIFINGDNATGNLSLIASGKVLDNAGIELGYKGLPQNAQTAAYTLVAADRGKHISITTGGITVPVSILSVGDAVSIVNNSAAAQTITQAVGVTLRLAGTATTGNRTLAQYGAATLLCIAANVFVISGAGLT